MACLAVKKEPGKTAEYAERTGELLFEFNPHLSGIGVYYGQIRTAEITGKFVRQDDQEHHVNRRKILHKILQGSKNISFQDFVNLVNGFGFSLIRVRGSHHIFSHPAVDELVNIQNVKGQVKPYQIRQFLKLAERYNLHLED